MTTAQRKPTKPAAAKSAASRTSASRTSASKAKPAAAKSAAKSAATKTSVSKAKSAAATPARKSRASTPAPARGETGPADVIVLTGPPSRMRATVSVENAVDQRVTVRGLTLHRQGAQAMTGSGAAVIAAGATAEVPVAFRLEPDTAPGEYAAQVEVGGIRRDALLRVEPDLSMHVSPRRVLAEVGRHPITLTAANDGNLPMALAAFVRARTDDGGPHPGPDVTLMLAQGTTLDPGTATVLRGHLVAPEELDPTRRHTARIPVGTADLDIIILPRDPSE